MFDRRSVPILAAALLLVTPAARGEEASGGLRILEGSFFSAGAGYVGGDAAHYGTFRGGGDTGFHGLLDAGFLMHDPGDGTWLTVTGSELGRDNRALTVDYERQGKWRYTIELDQVPRTDPRQVTTGLSGIGGANQAVSGTALRRVDIETRRDRGRFTVTRHIGEAVAVSAGLRYEEKSGARLFGAYGGGNFNFLTDPIDYVTHEVTGGVSYGGRRLQLDGGYIGSFFRNNAEVLANDTGQPEIALPMDSQAHRIHLGGGYDITARARTHFKLAYGIALQDEAFFTAPTFPGNTRNDLGGEVHTTLAQWTLNTRPLDRLRVTARLRYDDRDDRTEIAQYVNASASRTGFNIPFSRTTSTADIDARYRLPGGFGLTGGVKRERRLRSKPLLRQASFRDATDETSAEIGLRRALGESLGGAIAYQRAKRTGSNWNDGTAGEIDAINLGDRDRDKVKLSLDWAPAERFSAGLRAEYSDDRYDGRPLGPRQGSTRVVALDAAYATAAGWRFSGWLSLSDIRMDQATNGDGSDVNGAAVVDIDWAADQRQLGRAVGAGVRGRLAEDWEFGLDAQYAENTSEDTVFALGPDKLPSPTDIRYRQAGVATFLDYRVSARGRLRLSYAYARISAIDWTWQNWTYADGTSVVIPGREEAHVVGLAYALRW